MDLIERLWLVLKRRWLVLLGCIAVAAIAAALYNAATDRTYTASTELFLRAPDTKTSASAYQGDLFSRQRAQTYSNMLSSDELAQMVIDKLGLSMTPQELASQVHASTITNTVIMTVSATDPNPQRAANIANAYGSVFADYVARVENVELDPNVAPLVRVITTASADSAERSGFSPTIVLAAAAFGGVVLGIVVIWLLERYDTKLRSRRQIVELAEAQTIGRIPPVRGLTSDTVGDQLAESSDFGACAERLALIVDRKIAEISYPRSPFIVAVVGSSEGEGRSVVAQTLSLTLARRGYASAVVDATRDHLPRRRRRSSEDGNDNAEADAGTEARGERASQNAVDIVVVDTPAFAEGSGAEHAVDTADAAIIVVRPGQSTQEGLVELTAMLRAHETPVLGVVVNDASAPRTVAGVFS